MRRVGVAAAVVVVTVSILGAPAVADRAHARNRAVSGDVTGSSSYEFFSHGCGFVYQWFDLSFVNDHGSGMIHADTCGYVGNPSYLVGTFTLTTDRGAQLVGTLSGPIVGGTTSSITIQLTLTVTGGTRAFGHSAGTIEFDGTWNQDTSDVAGSLVGSLDT